MSWISSAPGDAEMTSAVAQRNSTIGTSSQLGNGVGVGGRGRWVNVTAHRGLEHARDRGKEASAASCGAIGWLADCAMPLRLARVRASLYVHGCTLARGLARDKGIYYYNEP